MLRTRPLPVGERGSWWKVHDNAARTVQADREQRELAAAALREECERLHPYGPPPPLVDPERWTELTNAVADSQYVTGITLSHWQIRAMAGFVADCVLIEAPAPTTREAMSA